MQISSPMGWSRDGQLPGILTARRRQLLIAWARVCWTSGSVGLATALVVAFLLRVHCLIFPYLWLDEFVTLWSIGGGSYGEMFDRSLHWTASAPLFVLCYRLSADLAGNLDWGLKLPGVIAGTLSVWAGWWTAGKLFRRTDVALVAAWLIALAPQFIHFSQEARPYMIGALLVLLALGFLASWIRSGRHIELAAVAVLSVMMVGFHLLAALALVGQNLTVLGYGMSRRWPIRRWIAWFFAQLAIAIVLWLGGTQFQTLSARHGSMILETKLPMETRQGLDSSLWGEVQIEFGFLVILGAIHWCAGRFPDGAIARVWHADARAVWLTAASYLVPTLLLSVLSWLRVIDCWPRYYFLFHPGFMISLAWLVVRVFTRGLSECLLAVLFVAMMAQWNWVGGWLSCRLNSGWSDFSRPLADLRDQLKPTDLVLSRTGLIEANHRAFLTNPVGASYLKCLVESKNGPLAADHLPLPFSPESEFARQYLERVFRETVMERDGFWLINVGPTDFDYRVWIDDQFPGRFRKDEELNYPFPVICHYVCAQSEPDRNGKKRNLRLGPRDRLEGSMPAVNVGITGRKNLLPAPVSVTHLTVIDLAADVPEVRSRSEKSCSPMPQESVAH